MDKVFCTTALVLAWMLGSEGVAAQMNQSPKIKVLYAFPGGIDGQYPNAPLIRDSEGNVYGTTAGSGSGTSQGNLFKISPSGEETILYSFGGPPDAQVPLVGLTHDRSGNLYGTTLDGGTAGFGTVFMLTKSGEERVLYSFRGGLDGANPRSVPVLDVAGNLYGTTVQGGGTECNGYGCGTVFEISPNGAETVLYRFAGEPDGANPESGIIRDAAGTLYGTTFSGGIYSYGTVYAVSPKGEETVLHNFAGPPDGAYPWGTLVRDAAGNSYGTTLAGGTFSSIYCAPGCGTVFKLGVTGNESVLHDFAGRADGSQPYGNLVRDKAGNLYGTAFGGGNTACDGGGGCGTLFRLSKNGVFDALQFNGTNGANPLDGLLVDSFGNIYGTTSAGGSYNYGVVFQVVP